jgi:hypothetical protein
MSAAPAAVQRSRVISYPKLSRAASPLRRAIGSVCLKLHLSAFLACALSWSLFSPSTSLILNGCIVGTTYIWLARAEARRGRLWLTPLSVFFFFYGVEMGPATVYIGYVLRGNPWLPFASTMIPARDLAAGYLISLVGMLAMHAGLETFRPRRGCNPEPRYLSTFPFLAFGVLLLCGVLSIYRPLAVIPFGVFAVLLQYGGMAALLPLAFATPRQLRISPLAHGTLFAVGTCVLLAASAASQNSSKMQILLAVLPLGTLIVQARRLRKWLPLAAAFGIFSYLALVAPAINNSRAISTVRGLTTWDKVVQSAETNSILAPGQSTWDLLSEQYGNLMMRMFEPPSATGFIVGEVARSGLQMGDTMRNLEYAFIPRIIWPSKPTVTRGAWFDSYLGMAPREAEATASVGMTAFGDWYWNFGIAGEIGGMFLIGILLGGLWRMAGDYPIFDPLRMLLYSALIVDAVMLPEASTVLVTMVALYLMFGGIMWLRSLTRRQPAVPTSAKSNAVTTYPQARLTSG